ncbi:hypothetical protein [uncultured Friedmanniella sp.]
MSVPRNAVDRQTKQPMTNGSELRGVAASAAQLLHAALDCLTAEATR